MSSASRGSRGLPQGHSPKLGSTRFTDLSTPGAFSPWRELHNRPRLALAEHPTNAACRSSAVRGPTGFPRRVLLPAGHGDVGGQPALIVPPPKPLAQRQGHRRIHSAAATSHASARSTSDSFVRCAVDWGGSIAAMSRCPPSLPTEDLAAKFAALREANADASVWLAMGVFSGRPVGRRSSRQWDPQGS